MLTDRKVCHFLIESVFYYRVLLRLLQTVQLFSYILFIWQLNRVETKASILENEEFPLVEKMFVDVYNMSILFAL